MPSGTLLAVLSWGSRLSFHAPLWHPSRGVPLPVAPSLWGVTYGASLSTAFLWDLCLWHLLCGEVLVWHSLRHWCLWGLSYVSLLRGTFLAAFLYEVALVWPPCGCSPLPCGTSFSVSQVYFVVTAFSYPPCGTTLMAFPLWHHRHGTEAQTQNQNPLLPPLPHTSS